APPPPIGPHRDLALVEIDPHGCIFGFDHFSILSPRPQHAQYTLNEHVEHLEHVSILSTSTCSTCSMGSRCSNMLNMLIIIYYVYSLLRRERPNPLAGPFLFL